MKERKPLITVGIPFYNAGDRILYAVKSVFAQTLDDWELILIDDGSIDGSIEYVRDIKDPRVIIIRDDVNRGLAYRLNQIIEMAKGKYIARMDADDLMHPERLEKQIEYMGKNPHIDIADTDAIIINKNLQPVGIRRKKNYKNKRDFLVNSFKYGCILHPSVMAKAEWYRRNFYDTTYRRAEDRELFIRVFKNTAFGHVDEPLHFYQFENNVKLKAYLMSYKEERRVILKYGPEYIGKLISYYLYSRSIVKSGTLMLFALLKIEQLVNKNKYEILENHLRNEILRNIEKIKDFDLAYTSM